MKKISYAILPLLSLAVLGSGGSLAQASEDIFTPPSYRADVNHDYRSGEVKLPTDPVPTLKEIMNQRPVSDEEFVDKEDRLRAPAMRDAALSYGARAGLSWASREINKTLQARAAELTRTYDFQHLLIKGPHGAHILPPVISEALDTWESFDAGKTLRVADASYEIIEQARFTPVAPLWQGYLVRDYSVPEPPPNALLPRNAGERDAWKRWVSEGWDMGIQQANEIFDADLKRLERDLMGMLRYKKMLEENKVSAPILAEGNLGVTGTGQDMRVNDRAMRITRDPVLELDPGKWNAAPTVKHEVIDRETLEPAVVTDRAGKRY